MLDLRWIAAFVLASAGAVGCGSSNRTEPGDGSTDGGPGDAGGDASADASADGGSDGGETTDAGALTPSEHIAYVRGDHIYVASADGSGEMQLTTRGQNRSPAWSPDGSALVYVSRTDSASDWELWTIAPDGTNEEQLFAPSGGLSSFGQPQWSPDGSRIAVQASTASDTSYDIVVVPADGGTAEVLVSTGDNEQAPTWAPDGSSIVYHNLSRLELWTVPAEGGDPSKLAGPFDALYTAYPDYSPLGDVIAFSIGDFQQDIYVVGADGTGEMQLTSLAGTESGATVSGDGSLVAFYHFPEDDSATGGVWRVELAGGEPELLVEGASNPAYGP